MGTTVQARDDWWLPALRQAKHRTMSAPRGAFADRQHRRRDLLLAGGFTPAEAETRTAGVIRGPR